MLSAEQITTPASILSEFKASDYATVLANIKRAQAERAAKVAKLREAATSAAESVPKIVSSLHHAVLNQRERFARALVMMNEFAEDGGQLDQTDELMKAYNDSEKNIQIAIAALTAIISSSESVRKLDPEAARIFVHSLEALKSEAKRAADQYRFFQPEFKVVLSRLKRDHDSEPEGRIAKAHKLYKRALETIDGVRSVGPLDKAPMMFTGEVLVYRLQVYVDKSLFSDRAKIRDIENRAHDAVEKEDPVLVGALVLDFEPASGDAA